MTPPKPPARPDRVSLWRYVRLFRQDILSAQPARLYRAWMAEFRTPFFRSYMVNDPKILDLVLSARPDDFPKSDRIGEGLRPLLGQSVFVTNGEVWKRQRRLIDPAFEGGRLRDAFPAMLAAGQACALRLKEGQIEVEEAMSLTAADVIFRTLFSIPIDHQIAREVFQEFRTYQRSQPILNLAAFVRLPAWFPRFHRQSSLKAARKIRALITSLTFARQEAISAGVAPDDLATKIMTATDPKDQSRFSTEEMVDQVAIFFLAGHETSASALAWAMYLLAGDPDIQDRAAGEAAEFPENAAFSDLSKLKFIRDIFRETLRLYPPVPMIVRENAKPETFRERLVKAGSQIVLSPWHLHRHERLWAQPDDFDPDRWGREETRICQRDAFLPFSKGPRVCPGAGFAMVEGAVLLAILLRHWRFERVDGKTPLPVAHLTVRSKDGIFIRLSPRSDRRAGPRAD